MKAAHYELGLSPLALVWKDANTSRYFVYTDKPNIVLCLDESNNFATLEGIILFSADSEFLTQHEVIPSTRSHSTLMIFIAESALTRQLFINSLLVWHLSSSAREIWRSSHSSTATSTLIRSHVWLDWRSTSAARLSARSQIAGRRSSSSTTRDRAASRFSTS